MDFISGLETPTIELFSMSSLIKLLFIVIIVGYILYSFMLTLRVRILSDTVNTPSNTFAKTLAYSHLLVSLVGGLFALILVLVG